MSNNNIDSLQINISAATSGAITNIDKLVDSLSRLKTALSVDADSSQFTKNIGSMVSGFRQLGTALSGIDASQIKSVQKSMDSLFGTMSKLSNGSFANVGKKAALSESVKAQIADLKVGIKEYENILKSFYSNLPKHIDLPKNWVSKLGEEDAKHKRGVLGIDRTSVATGGMNQWAEVYEAAGHSGLLSWEEMSKVTGDEVDVLSVIIDRVDELNSKVSTAKEEISRLKRTASEVSASPILDENAIATPEMFEKTNAITTSVQSISNMGEAAAENMRQIAEGLAEFQGITISADQFAGLPKLASSAAQLSASSGESIANAMSGIGKGLTELSTVQLPNAENLTTVVNAISKFGRGSIQNAGASVSSIANGLRELTPVAENLGGIDTEKIISIATAMGKFGSAGAGRAATNLPQIAQGFVQLAQALATAPEVSDKTLRLAEAMAQVSRRSLETQTNAKGLSSNFKLLGNHAHKASFGFNSLAAKIGYLYANFFLLIRAARLAGKAIEYSSQMTETMNVVDVAFGKANGKMKDFMETSIKTFGLGRLAAAQYASRFQAMGKTLGITAEEVGKANDFIAEKTEGNANAYKDLGDSVAGMSINLTKLTADMASLYNQDYDSVAQDMQAVYTGMTRPLRKYGLDLTQATLKEWALANGLQADIDKMTQAEKTLLRYQYVMSNASIAMGDFQKTADTWANAMRTVKQLLQEFGRLLGEGFINAFKPALLAFRNFIYTMLDLTQKGLNAIGSLLGWEKIDFGGAALTEDMEDLADATDDAAGAAKKLKGQLRGIDELNNLTTSDKGGGGGGSASGIGYNGADLWEQIKETKEKYISDIDSWKELGERISEKIFEGLSNIDWDSRTEGARNFGTNLASFLNGLIEPRTFKEVGKTIAKTIMLGVNFADAFADEFEWEELGTSIGEGINGFFDNFDGVKAAEAITKIAHGLDTALTRAVGQINWGEVFKDLFDFFGHLAIDNMDLIVKYLAITNGIGFVANFTTTLLAEIGKQLAAKIAAKAGIELTGMTITTIGSSFGVQLAQGVAANIAKQTGAKVTTALASQTVTAELGEVSVGVGAGTKILGASTVGGYIGAAIVAAVVGYFTGNWLQEEISKLTGDDTWLVKPHVGIESPGYKYNPTTYTSKKTAVDALNDKAKNFNISNSELDRGIKTYRTFSNTVRSATQQIYDTKAAEAFAKINNATKKSASNASSAGTAFEEMGRSISRSSSSAYEGIISGSTKAFTNVTDSSNKASNNANKNLNAIRNTAGNAFSFNVWSTYGDNIKNSLGSSIDDVKARWESLQKSMSSSVQISGTSSGGGSSVVTYVTTTTSTPKAVTNIDAPGIKSNPTWHNLPTKPSGMPESAWASYLENWKKNNLGNYYAQGGFPEIASLFWAGENGVPELLGTVGGKTAVAGGSEITGIRDAIMQTAGEEIGVLRQQNTLLQAILEKEFGISNDALFRSVRNSANDFRMRTGRGAF